MKRFLFLILIVSFNVSAAEQAITQWVYNTLERAQANLDKGNVEAAERIYYDYSNDTWSSRSYDHFVILRTYAYFLLSFDRNEEALRYLKQASLKRDMPPYDIFELNFTLGQVYYVTGDRENAKKTLLKWVEIGEKEMKDSELFKKIKGSKIPLLLLINKIDTADQETLLTTISFWKEKLPEAEIFPIFLPTTFVKLASTIEEAGL